ncbi:MAG: sulfate adenylyltransferase [Planctomycetes bacterium]|nr:sulfate adenylyltransferase [Planctomycetota bacterium]
MNQPHGGVLVDRACPESERPARKKHALTLPRLPADRNLVLEIEKIANGTFSPLTGFMTLRDVESVLEDMSLANGLPWTIPIIFHAQRAALEGVEPGDEVALWNAEADAPSAIMKVSEIYEIDKPRIAQSVFGVTTDEHPGVGQLLGWGDMAVAGDIELVEHSKSLIPDAYDRSPAQVRAEFERRGWKRIVGFQTRNLGHRAHEHLQKIALEQVDGLLIHPLIGWKKKGDMLPEVILDGYEILIDRYFVADNVMLSGLTTSMRYAGPKEAVFHAIIRKNFGCTHFIVGRDHAGVGGYYGKYAAHQLFDRIKGDLGIQIMRLHGPCWCDTCEAIVTEHTCPHEDAWVQISGTEVRAMLARGECPPRSFMRPEIGNFLVQRAKENRVFF